MAFAQKNGGRQITGKLLDAQTKEPLIGATVAVKGTTTATSVSLDGSFKFRVPAGTTTLTLSYIGYVSKDVEITGDDLGTITLDPSASSMKEVVITGDIAIDRKTPVAVTTLSARYIEEKIGNQDLPSVMRTVPGVMATNTQGYGDSRVSIRGFSAASTNSGNVALTINGIPVNDMENGYNYWSDFTGLSDVTTSTQIQRGLGASKIIVPSFGGTVNITTRNTDAVKGGYVFEGIGSDGYNKMGVLVSSGLTKNGWAATFQGSKTEGNYYADNTEFLNYNYFFNLSKVISPSQTLSFSIMGAVQHHNQRYKDTLRTIRDAPQGNRYNVDAGILNGDAYNPYINYYSKPIASLNHSWVINEKSSLSTVLYGTYGTGGGVSLSSTAGLTRVDGAPYNRVLPNGTIDYSPINLTAIEKANAASVDGSVTVYDRAAVNNHHWFGLRSTYTTQLTDDINLAAGIDLRDYEGSHYQQVYKLFGGQYVMDGKNTNDPTAHAGVGDKVGYYNTDNILSGGAYAQAEYTKNDLSAFLTLSGSDSRYKRNDYFLYAPPLQHSPWVNFFNYQAKGGANYNINDQMNIFANVGYITKPPYFGNIFVNNTNNVNKSSVSEKLFSYELGYGYKISSFSATLNLYRSNYMDRAFIKAFQDPNQAGIYYTANITGVNEMHEGGELELKYQPVETVTITGGLSVGNWYYTKDSGPAVAYDDQNNVVAGSSVNSIAIKNLKVGDQPQTQGHIGLDIDVLPDLRVGSDYFFNGNYTSDYITGLTSIKAGFKPWKIPNYNTVDLNASFKFKLAGLDASLNGNVNNLLNAVYISDASDFSATGNPNMILGYYGYARTFSTSLKIKF